MRALRLMAAFALVAGIFCGGGEQPAQVTEGAAPSVAFEPLSEEELGKCLKALPGVTVALQAAEYAPEEKEGEEIEATLARTVDGMKDVAGVEEALAAAGTNWDEFNGAMRKLMATTTALSFDALAGMFEGVTGDDEESAEMKAELDKAKAFSAKVPEANKQLVVQHMDELEALGAVQ